MEGLMIEESLANVVEIEPKGTTPEDRNERDLYRLIKASTGMVGGADKAAEIMKVNEADLSRALNGKGRYLAIEHVMRFGGRLAQYSPETSQRIAAAVMRPFDLIAFPRVQMTAAERARRHENMLRVIGAAMGVDLVAKSLETP